MKRDASRTKLLDATFIKVYEKGYYGTGTASILEHANVPKGSMYHYFKSKKDLMLATISERIFPKMHNFFDFTAYSEEDIFKNLKRIFDKMSSHELLIKHGCPMHRLIVEMSDADHDFEKLLVQEFDIFIDQIASLLNQEIENERMKEFDTEGMARFIITSIWGEISLPPSRSSKESFLRQTDLILITLSHYRIQ